MTCPQCGTSNEAKAAFCSNCGASLPKSTVAIDRERLSATMGVPLGVVAGIVLFIVFVGLSFGTAPAWSAWFYGISLVIVAAATIAMFTVRQALTMRLSLRWFTLSVLFVFLGGLTLCNVIIHLSRT